MVGTPTEFQVRRAIVLVGVVLITALVHSPCLRLGFNAFMDQYYVLDNPFCNPFTFSLGKRAFTSYLEGNYHPLTLISHALDYTIWGERPFGHHFTGFLLHLLNVLLVFLLVERLSLMAGWSPTGKPVASLGLVRLRSPPVARYKNPEQALSTSAEFMLSGAEALSVNSVEARAEGSIFGPRLLLISAFTALCFGIHPLRVESVAWVTERKDVLFAFFYLLALLLYCRWRGKGGRWWYFGALACYLCSALSKAMAVSWPVLTLLLDHEVCSLQNRRSWARSFFRVLPFAVIALLAAFMAVRGQRLSQLMVPLTPRIALINILEFPAVLWFYVSKTIWPVVLLPVYPLKLVGPAGGLLVSWLLTTGAVAGAVVIRRRHPLPLVLIAATGIMLLPAGGLVRVGAQVLADRFSLLPTIPLLYAISWTVAWVAAIPSWRRWLALPAVAWMALLVGKTVSYTSLWDDPISLMGESYRHYPDSPPIRIFMVGAYNNASIELVARGDYQEAMRLYRQALRIDPDYDAIHHNLGLVLDRLGRSQEAIAEFKKAIARSPGFIDAYRNLAGVLKRQGRVRQAIAIYRQGVAANPEAHSLRIALGFELFEAGQTSEAAAQFARASVIEPEDGIACVGLGLCALREGNAPAARQWRDEALRRGEKNIPSELLNLK